VEKPLHQGADEKSVGHLKKEKLCRYLEKTKNKKPRSQNRVVVDLGSQG
jgi:hypothetical protein